MRDERINNRSKISNLRVTDKFARVALTSIIAFCGSIAGFHYIGKNPVVVDKDVRYLTSPHPSRAFKGFYDNDEFLYVREYGTWTKDGDVYTRPVKQYNCNYKPYNKIIDAVETANKKGPEVLVEVFGEPDAAWPEIKGYLSQSDLLENDSVKLFGKDRKGEFVVEDESFKDNAIATLAPLGLAATAAFLTSAAYEDKKEYSKRR